MLAREVGPKLGFWKPVVVSHHMLMGLEGIKKPEGFDDSASLDTEISSKMSKSKPSSAIFVHDSTEQIAKKLANAYCPPKIAESNPVLEYARHLVFRSFNEFCIERPAKFGGDVSFASYNDLETAYVHGALHPSDLKNAVAVHLDKMISPIRAHFEKNARARELYEFVKKQQVTR
jgi:tyrosyl-tRNA synthetase